MFESAELGHSIEKSVYDQEVPALREALLNAQFDLETARKFPVIILIAGLDGAGKSATTNTLNEWMDPRYIQTHGTSDPSDEELERGSGSSTAAGTSGPSSSGPGAGSRTPSSTRPWRRSGASSRC